MTEDKKIVEVTATNDGGKQVPVGIMNTKQALSLPQEMDISDHTRIARPAPMNSSVGTNYGF